MPRSAPSAAGARPDGDRARHRARALESPPARTGAILAADVLPRGASRRCRRLLRLAPGGTGRTQASPAGPGAARPVVIHARQARSGMPSAARPGCAGPSGAPYRKARQHQDHRGVPCIACPGQGGELFLGWPRRTAARPVLAEGKWPRTCAGPGPPALACASPLRPGLTSSWSRPRASGSFRFPFPICSFRVPVPFLSPSMRFARIPARSGRPLRLAGHHPPYAARRASQRTKVPRRAGRRSPGPRGEVLTSVQRTSDIDTGAAAQGHAA